MRIGPAGAQARTKMLVIPKLIGIPYFTSTGEGAQEAAEELGADLTYNGPTDASIEGQISIINQGIRRRVGVIAIAATDADALSPALKRAQEAGIQVVTWDSDVQPAARSFYLEAVSDKGMAKALVDSLVQDGLTEGPVAVLTGSATAANLNSYIEAIRAYMAASYPKLGVSTVMAGDEDAVKSKSLATSYFQGNPDTKGLIVLGASMTAGLEAPKGLGLIGKVAVAGQGLPSVYGGQIKDGTLTRFVLWNPVDLGYGAVYLAAAVAEGKAAAGTNRIAAGRLGELAVANGVVTLAAPFVFTKDNVDQFKF